MSLSVWIQADVGFCFCNKNSRVIRQHTIESAAHCFWEVLVWNLAKWLEAWENAKCHFSYTVCQYEFIGEYKLRKRMQYLLSNCYGRIEWHDRLSKCFCLLGTIALNHSSNRRLILCNFFEDWIRGNCSMLLNGRPWYTNKSLRIGLSS